MQSKRTFLAVMAAATLAMGGCASLPSPEAMRAEVADFQPPKLPDPGKAMVYVVRPSFAGTLIRFNVFLNDKEAASEMGYTRGKEYIYFSVPPGNHNIYSKAENWAELLVGVKAGDMIFIEQQPAFGFIIARNNLARLDDVQGKYHVKTLKVGTILKTEK